jgi:hypothetical protein
MDPDLAEELPRGVERSPSRSAESAYSSSAKLTRRLGLSDKPRPCRFLLDEEEEEEEDEPFFRED